MPTIVTRLTNTGNLLVNGSFDEITLQSNSNISYRVTPGTVFSKQFDEVSLGAGSINFEGSEYILVNTTNDSGNIGTGDFTWDAWVYPLNFSTDRVIFDGRDGGSQNSLTIRIVATTGIFRQSFFGPSINIDGTAVQANTWTHLAITRNGTTLRLFQNGVITNTVTNSTSITNGTNRPIIGASGFTLGNASFLGYISNVRLIKGQALYTANFIPQQTVLESTANTSVLLNVLNSTDFRKDNGPYNFATSVSGTPSWSAFGPFNNNVTGLVERRLPNATLIKGQFDEYTGISGDIQYIGNTTNIINPASNTFTVDYPAGTQNGDLAIIGILGSNNFGTDFTANSWTKIDRQVVQTGVRSQLSYTVVSGTSSQTFTRTGSTIVSPSYILVVFRNTTYSSYAFANNSTASPDSPSLTGSFNCVVSFGFTAATDTAVDPPSGYVLANNVSNVSSLMSAYSIGNQTNPDPGSFQNVTSGAWHAYTVGLV